MIKINTYFKLVLLIAGISSLFLLMFLSLYIYTTQKEKEVFETTSKQYASEIITLFDFNSKTQIVTINDLTYWDTLVNFTKTKDKAWFQEHIVNEFPTYEVDYVGIYGLDKERIARHSSSKINTSDFILKEAMTRLHQTRFSRFYMKIPEGVIEVFGGTIHPSNDPKKNKTMPSGYFFMARLLDNQYFKNLGNISSSTVFLANDKILNATHRRSVQSIIILKDSENNVAGKLLFIRPFHLNSDSTIDILNIIIFITLISITFSIYCARKWVYIPLRLVTNILENNEENAIIKLKKEPGEFGYIANLFEDNSNQRKQLENAKHKAEENDKLKSTFLANLSHEIRTPMNAIIGFSDLLSDDNLAEEVKNKYLKIIKNSGKNLVSIIEDLIEMSKIDAKQITPNHKGIDLEKCIEDLYNTLKVTIPEEKKIEFYVIKSNQKLEGNILTDEIKLKQIIVNLLTNAIKFTSKGHVSFGYTVNHKESTLVFRVEDTGLGIDKSDLKVIFDRFRRVEDDFSIEISGLGLGLSISKAYVEMLGGTIKAESSLGVGSVFEFTIPLLYDEKNKVSSNLDFITYIENKESKTILIAEDDNINFLLFKIILELKNHHVIRAENGQLAVNICTVNPAIDLVFMDIKMPVLDGYGAFEKIKLIKPNLPVIAQTAHSSADVKEKILVAGFTDYITKPLDKEKVYKIIDKVFQPKNLIS